MSSSGVIRWPSLSRARRERGSVARCRAERPRATVGRVGASTRSHVGGSPAGSWMRWNPGRWWSIAPAGYGKTTALAEAVGMAGWDVAWLPCSPSDRDPGRLLVHLVGSIRRAVPGAADVLGERLDVATAPVDPGLAVQALESELERLLVEPLVVVIDDAEHLAGAAEAEQVVADLVATPLKTTACGRRRAPAAGAADGEAQRRRPAHGTGPGRPCVRRGGMRRADAAPGGA